MTRHDLDDCGCEVLRCCACDRRIGTAEELGLSPDDEHTCADCLQRDEDERRRWSERGREVDAREDALRRAERRDEDRADDARWWRGE